MFTFKNAESTLIILVVQLLLYGTELVTSKYAILYSANKIGNGGTKYEASRGSSRSMHNQQYLTFDRRVSPYINSKITWIQRDRNGNVVDYHSFIYNYPNSEVSNDYSTYKEKEQSSSIENKYPFNQYKTHFEAAIKKLFKKRLKRSVITEERHETTSETIYKAYKSALYFLENLARGVVYFIGKGIHNIRNGFISMKHSLNNAQRSRRSHHRIKANGSPVKSESESQGLVEYYKPIVKFNPHGRLSNDKMYSIKLMPISLKGLFSKYNHESGVKDTTKNTALRFDTTNVAQNKNINEYGISARRSDANFENERLPSLTTSNLPGFIIETPATSDIGSSKTSKDVDERVFSDRNIHGNTNDRFESVSSSTPESSGIFYARNNKSMIVKNKTKVITSEDTVTSPKLEEFNNRTVESLQTSNKLSASEFMPTNEPPEMFSPINSTNLIENMASFIKDKVSSESEDFYEIELDARSLQDNNDNKTPILVVPTSSGSLGLSSSTYVTNNDTSATVLQLISTENPPNYSNESESGAVSLEYLIGNQTSELSSPEIPELSHLININTIGKNESETYVLGGVTTPETSKSMDFVESELSPRILHNENETTMPLLTPTFESSILSPSAHGAIPEQNTTPLTVDTKDVFTDPSTKQSEENELQGIFLKDFKGRELSEKMLPLSPKSSELPPLTNVPTVDRNTSVTDIIEELPTSELSKSADLIEVKFVSTSLQDLTQNETSSTITPTSKTISELFPLTNVTIADETTSVTDIIQKPFTNETSKSLDAVKSESDAGSLPVFNRSDKSVLSEISSNNELGIDNTRPSIAEQIEAVPSSELPKTMDVSDIELEARSLQGVNGNGSFGSTLPPTSEPSELSSFTNVTVVDDNTSGTHVMEELSTDKASTSVEPVNSTLVATSLQGTNKNNTSRKIKSYSPGYSGSILVTNITTDAENTSVVDVKGDLLTDETLKPLEIVDDEMDAAWFQDFNTGDTMVRHNHEDPVLSPSKDKLSKNKTEITFLDDNEEPLSGELSKAMNVSKIEVEARIMKELGEMSEKTLPPSNKLNKLSPVTNVKIMVENTSVTNLVGESFTNETSKSVDFVQNSIENETPETIILPIPKPTKLTFFTNVTTNDRNTPVTEVNELLTKNDISIGNTSIPDAIETMPTSDLPKPLDGSELDLETRSLQEKNKTETSVPITLTAVALSKNVNTSVESTTEVMVIKEFSASNSSESLDVNERLLVDKSIQDTIKNNASVSILLPNPESPMLSSSKNTTQMVNKSGISITEKNGEVSAFNSPKQEKENSTSHAKHLQKIGGNETYASISLPTPESSVLLPSTNATTVGKNTTSVTKRLEEFSIGNSSKQDEENQSELVAKGLHRIDENRTDVSKLPPNLELSELLPSTNVTKIGKNTTSVTEKLEDLSIGNSSKQDEENESELVAKALHRIDENMMHMSTISSSPEYYELLPSTIVTKNRKTITSPTKDLEVSIGNSSKHHEEQKGELGAKTLLTHPSNETHALV